MSVIADYAHLYESEIRPRRERRRGSLRYLCVLAVWAGGLYLLRPELGAGHLAGEGLIQPPGRSDEAGPHSARSPSPQGVSRSPGFAASSHTPRSRRSRPVV